MKSKTSGAQNSLNATTNSRLQTRNACARYAAAIVLLLVVYTLSNLNPVESERLSSTMPVHFVWFWLTGGGLTLVLLMIAKRKSI